MLRGKWNANFFGADYSKYGVVLEDTGNDGVMIAVFFIIMAVAIWFWS